MATEKIEIGFELTTAGGPFLTLDNAISGKLDDPAWPLGGLAFYDLTSRVRQYSIQRGKSRALDSFPSGKASVVLNNNDRAFDPTFTASPFYGQVIPRRELRITSNSIVQYQGLIDDWNLDYAPQGDSTALAVASDGFAKLANQTLPASTATAQLSGARINAVLDNSDVNWPTADRLVDAGEFVMGEIIATDTNVLTYLQNVERSENGRLFIDKSGRLVYKDNNGVQPNGATLVTLADDGTGVKYTGMQVVYGSELLYNQIVIGSPLGGTVVANSPSSQGVYGIWTYTETDLLNANGADIDTLALQLVNQYDQPEFRFESVEINFKEISTADQTAILGLEIGSVCRIRFTPNNIPPVIEKYAEVISISHNASVQEHRVTLGFATLDYIGLILDDAVFGKLDSATIG